MQRVMLELQRVLRKRNDCIILTMLKITLPGEDGSDGDEETIHDKVISGQDSEDKVR